MRTKSNNENHHISEIQNMLDKYIIISQLSEGGITFSDCDNMDSFELEYIARKLINLRKEENKIREKQVEEMKKKSKM